VLFQHSTPPASRRHPNSAKKNTARVGDGNPHQNYFYIQVSETNTCSGGSDCSVAHTTSETIGWTASMGGAQWISGGFAVSESWTIGNSYSCSAHPGETVCVWHKVAHTAYTVQNVFVGSTCLGTEDTSDYILFSPNTNNVGGGYYCVVGSCRNYMDSYWVKDGRAGGP
jgi:hypothetical protein